MLLDNKPYDLDRVVRLVLKVLFFIGLIYLLGLLSDVLIPFAVAMVMAYFINPLVKRCNNVIKHRALSVAVSLALILLMGIGCLFLVVPAVTQEVVHMAKLLNEVANNSELAQKASSRLGPELWHNIREQVKGLDVLKFYDSGKLDQFLTITMQKALPTMLGAIEGTTSILLSMLGMVVILLYLVFILLDYSKVMTGWHDLLPTHVSENIVSFLGEFDEAMNRYFRAQAFVAFLVGIFFSIGFSLIGLPLAILLGMFIGLLNLIPYMQMFGFIPAFFLAIVYALETGQSFSSVMGLVVLVFVVVQIIQDAILVPRIMGKVTGLSPAIILLSLSIWGKLLGLLGLIIALPMTCLLLTWYRRGLLENQK
ncbi:MAG: AI-2E family transporter [Planctomycetes bacterium]|nr:AI-2E family transporter [Planctomycetota bacterium]